MAGMVVVISEKYRGQVLWNMSFSTRTVDELKAESKVNKLAALVAPPSSAAHLRMTKLALEVTSRRPIRSNLNVDE
jgi:hypothetical protein